MNFGKFKVDSLILVDKFDLTQQEQQLYKEIWSAPFDNIHIVEFIKHYLPDKLKEFYYIPHQWLTYDGLILDAASDMFNEALEQPINESNYIYK